MQTSAACIAVAAPGAGGAAVGNAMHAISIHDVASDTVHQFAPTYRNYVLYSDKHDDDSKPDEAPKRTFRAKTFVPVEAVRRHHLPASFLCELFHSKHGCRRSIRLEVLMLVCCCLRGRLRQCRGLRRSQRAVCCRTWRWAMQPSGTRTARQAAQRPMAQLTVISSRLPRQPQASLLHSRRRQP